jgi:hypothetical protein
MEGVRKWGIPAVLIGAGVLLLLTGLIRGSGPWTLMGAGLTLLAGVLALMLAMHRLDRRTGLTLGVLLLLATVLLGWRNVRSVARSNEFAAAVAERNALVVQSLKDVRTVQLGYRQAYGHFTADVDALRQFVQHGHVPLVFKTRVSGTPDEAAPDTVWVPVMERLFGLTSAQQDRMYPFDPATFGTLPGTDQELIVRAGHIDRDGVLVPVFEAKDPEPWSPGDTLSVGSMTTPSLEGNWTGR